VFDKQAFEEGRRLRGIYRVQHVWSVFPIVAGALILLAAGLQMLATPDFRLPGTTWLYGRFLSACTADAEQAGMMASRALWAAALSGAVVYYLARTWTAPTADDRAPLHLKRSHAYGFVLFLAIAAWMFVDPESRGGQALACDQALRNQFEFWRTAIAGLFMAVACHIWTEGLNARRR